MTSSSELEKYIRTVRRWADANGMLRGLTLCGFSGGADSLAMLLLLRELGADICAAHVNHHLRGAEAERDAEYCRAICEKYGVPFALLEGDAAEVARRRGEGVESGARELRYSLLAAEAERVGAQETATAHTRDDNLETVLLNLTRGAALRGLSGIPPRNGSVVRPILPLAREDTEAIVKLFGETAVTDSTNNADEYARNRIRHQVMPVLRAQNVAASATVFENCLALRADADYLDALARDAEDKISLGFNRLDAAALAALPKPIAARVVLRCAGRAGADMSGATAEAALALASSASPSASADIGGGLVCRREYGALCFEKPCSERVRRAVITGPGRYELGAGFAAEVAALPSDNEYCEKIYKLFNSFAVNCDKILGELVVRPREKEDRFARNGKSGSKPLSRVMIDLKLPAALRDTVPVVADGGGVLMVYGIGVNAKRPKYDPQREGLSIKIVTDKEER